MKRWMVVAAVLAAAACAGGGAEAARAVREYDEEVIRAFRTSNPSRLIHVATRKEADRVLVIVDLKTSNKLVLEPTLERFEVKSSKVLSGSSAAEVVTEERWRYFDRPIAPGRAPGPEIVSEMRMRYDCVREDGRWKVAEVTTLANEILEPKGRTPAGEQGRASHQAPGAGTVRRREADPTTR